MIPAWVEQYVGIPYVAEGADIARDGGLDCWGLIKLIWRERYGIELPIYDGPHWKPGADRVAIAIAIQEAVARYQIVLTGEEREGDGIILRMLGNPLHVGLVVTPGWMIHSNESAASCVEDYRRMAWSRRVIGFRRHV